MNGILQAPKHQWREFSWAVLYMLPAIVVFLVFSYIPFIRAIHFSFFIVDRNTFEPSHFYGLNYYARIFNIGEAAVGDDYLKSMLSSLWFTILVVPAGIVFALLMALIAETKVKGVGVFRTIFTTSVAISIASAGVIWSLMFSPNVPLTSWLIRLLNIHATSLLTDASSALICVAIMTIWTGLGFNFLILLAGLQSVPKELMESARIDGAGHGKAFWHITLPLIGPTLIFLLVISTIASLQAFTQFKVMIDSVGPNNSTNVFVYAIFNTFWMENNYGFASAMSVLLFLITLGFSVLQFRLDRRVHYQ